MTRRNALAQNQYDAVLTKSRPSCQRRKRTRRLLVEGLESRRLLATLTVNTAADTIDQDPLTMSLREALKDANSHAGPDEIKFEIPAPSGDVTITLNSPLPSIHDAGTQILGLSQPGSAGTPLVEINAENLADGQAAIWVTSTDTIIEGLVVNRANGVGVFLSPGADRTIIRDNYIGTDTTGGIALGNAFQGIYVASASNEILGNVISGNDANGIWLAGSDGNQIRENLIGVNASGDTALGNGINGIYMSPGASLNVIADNVISGNGNTGIWMQGGVSNMFQGNRIGTDITGLQDLGNVSTGMRVSDGSTENTIGTDANGQGDDASEGNVISGNGGRGFEIYNDDTQLNSIRGNVIGLDLHGDQVVANDFAGMYFSGTSNTAGGDTEIERNLVSGNSGTGIEVAGRDNSLIGNYVGLDATGLQDRGNSGEGVVVLGDENRIHDNTISANDRNGVIVQPGADENSLSGNRVGTNAFGSAKVGNRFWGIWHAGGQGNRIGVPSDVPTDRNIVSGNGQGGIAVWGTTSIGTLVRNNYVGTDLTGTVKLENASNGILIGYMFAESDASTETVVGGTGTFAGNLVSGNVGSGIWVRGLADATVQGNIVGLAADGETPLGNSLTGIQISGSGNVIGGGTPEAANVISGNGLYGVGAAPFATSNLVHGNKIGTDHTGTIAVGNASDGVHLTGQGNDVVGNLISGNQGSGIFLSDEAVLNRLVENLIGTDQSGNAPLGNHVQGIKVQGDFNEIWSNIIAANGASGIEIDHANGSKIYGNTIGLGADGVTELGHPAVGIYVVGSGNRIGSRSDDGTGNIIAASGYSGIEFFGAESFGNFVQGNSIGTDRTGTIARGNGTADVFDSTGGIYLGVGTARNAIGSDGDGFGDLYEGNLISGNLRDGVRLAGSVDNLIAGNLIGTDASGNDAIPNSDGIRIESGANRNQVGGDSAVMRNVISGNSETAVFIQSSHENWVSGNYLGTDLSGTHSIENAGPGVWIRAASTRNIVGTNGDGTADENEGNLVSGNTFGVRISNLGSVRNTVAGNLIGTNATGSQVLGNRNAGVFINNGASDNHVGIMSVGTQRNVISGNRVGVLLSQTSGNRIAGNLIGTDESGLIPLGNAIHGIAIEDGATNNLIGTDSEGQPDVSEGNIIAASQFAGVFVSGSGTVGNRVFANSIGTNPDLTAQWGNGTLGIVLQGGTRDNVIGGPEPALANRIAFNHAGGIDVRDTSSRNAIRSNAIARNLGLGIDLADDGVTANDTDDSDVGANGLVNFPEIELAAHGTSTLIMGTYQGAANSEFTIDLFASLTADPSGYGEGERYLGSTDIATDESGSASFEFTAAGVNAGEVVTVTATDTAGNTSEFSMAEPVSELALSGEPTVDEGTAYELRLPDVPAAWSVDWGDGTLQNYPLGSPIVSHVYADGPANYVITAAAVFGTSPGIPTNTLSVEVLNAAPVVNAGSSRTIIEGQSIAFASGDLALPDGSTLPGASNAAIFYDHGFSHPRVDDPSQSTSETFSASVEWGDGSFSSTTDGSLVLNFQTGSTGTPSIGSISGEHAYLDDGVYVATLSVSDDDGGVTTKTFEVTVANADPTVDFSVTSPVMPGENALLFDGTFTDLGIIDTHRAAIDWDGDGVAEVSFDVDGGIIPEVTQSFVDSGTYDVTVTVTDDEGGFGRAVRTVEVLNQPPTGSLSAEGLAYEGTAATIEFVDLVDEPGDLAAGLRFSFALDPDDLATSYADASLSSQSQFTFSDDGDYEVYGRVFDIDGGSSDASLIVTVLNVAPSLENLAVTPVINEGEIATLTGTIIDPGTEDSFTIEVDWGDAVESYSLAAGTNEFSLEHLYDDDGPTSAPEDTYTVWVTSLADDDGASTLAIGTQRVSIGSAGQEANEISAHPSISSDGRYVAFSTFSNNLVDGDTNETSDVFVRDLSLGITTRVSLNSAAQEADHSSGYPSISSNGRYVTFTSSASNLVEGDANAGFDVFVRDVLLGTTTCVSLDPTGQGASQGSSYSSSISTDGRYVAFYSLANNLVDGDHNGAAGIFVHTQNLHSPIAVVVRNVAPSIEITSLGSIGLSGEVLILASDPSLADEVNGFDFVVDWGDGNVDEITASPNNGNGLLLEHLYTATGSFDVTVTAIDKDGGIGTTTTTIDVQIDPRTIEDDLQDAVDLASTSGDPKISLEITRNAGFSAVVNAINRLQQPASEVTIVLDLGGGTYSGKRLKPPAGLVIVIQNGKLRGASPALVVEGGTVRIESSELTNDTDAPSLEVIGGSVTVRGSRIVESGLVDQVAVLVSGGTVDLGTQDSAGGNVFEIIGSGTWIQNLGEQPVPAVGNQFVLDSQTESSGFRIEDGIDHRLDGSSGLVEFVSGEVFVTADVGSIQAGIDAIADHGVVRIEGKSYPDYEVGTRLLTVAFELGPIVQQSSDTFAHDGRSLYVTATENDDQIKLATGPGDTSVIRLNDFPIGSFSPNARVTVFAGDGDDDIQLSGNYPLDAWLYGENGDDRISPGAGSDAVFGGPGDDLLIGKQGRDLLVGGSGADRLIGNADDDILIAGLLAFAPETDQPPGDQHALAIFGLMAEWTSARDHETRVRNLSGEGDDSRVNGDYFLKHADDPNTPQDDRTVDDDEQKDVLTGASGEDWFFLDFDRDRATDLKDEAFANNFKFLGS